MNKQQKAVSHLLALALVNTGVIGLGLAIYQNRPLALIAGVISIAIGCLIEWRATE